MTRYESRMSEIIKASYTDAKCPDCDTPLVNEIANGDDCVTCGHTFYATPESVAEYVMENMPAKTYLMYVERDDQFNADQIQKMFQSQMACDEVEMEIRDAFWDSEYDSIDYVITELVGSEGLEILRESNDEMDRVREKAMDNDASDPMKDLERNTGNMLMRYRLSDEWADWPMEANSWNFEAEKLEQEARKLAAIANVPYEQFIKELNEIVGNATYGGSPEVIWYGSPFDILADLVADDDGAWIARGTISFEDPHLAVIDNMNGSGHDAQLKGISITVPFDPSRVVIDDAKGNGYGWDAICGVYKPAYATNVALK